jgi:hypothetical protein
MYIIVSTTLNYKGQIIGYDCIIRANTIGHEIHITRPILLFLLSNKLISEDDTIVTKNNERFFFYSEIFKNIIQYDDLPKINEDQILDITHMNALFEEKLNFNFKIKLEETFPILKKIRINEIEIRTNIFNELMRKIKYVDINIFDTDYVVFHHRETNYGSVDIQESIKIINNISLNHPDLNIVIFTITEPFLFSFNSDKIKFVKRIDTYASYINNEKCIAVISPFSGGGQLTQYCHNKKIYYYETIGGYEMHKNLEDIFKTANEKNNMYSYFDYKKITDASVCILKNSEVKDLIFYL